MTIEIVPTDKLTADSSLAQNWNRKVASERNLYAMYQAPAWLHCLQPSGPPAQLVVARNGAGSEPDCLAVVARESEDTATAQTLVVRRDGPNGEALTTPKRDSFAADWEFEDDAP